MVCFPLEVAMNTQTETTAEAGTGQAQAMDVMEEAVQGARSYVNEHDIEADNHWRQELLVEFKAVESFVTCCLKRTDPVVKEGRPIMGQVNLRVLTVWKGHFNRLHRWVELLCHEPRRMRHSRSARVELFESCLQALGLHLCDWFGANASAVVRHWDVAEQCFVERSDGQRYGELFQNLVDCIRAEGRRPGFQKKLQGQRRDAARNRTSALAYNNRLFERRSRLVVIRLDLGYKREVAQNISLKQLNRDLNRFLRNRRHNRMFEHLYGFIIKVEEGPLRGLHTHVVLYFLGSEVRKHGYLGERIGRYWEKQITPGRGMYFNCNSRSYKYPGIGVIERYDLAKRANLRERVLGYLFEDDQHVQVRGGRVFRRGVMPALALNKTGRPRASARSS